mmetsp:Transcript_7094/g.10588  ORF Transcript_7094/g.10588 Transcript_7094/m.10588 type:complete len:232 (-) Transcript_7094:176-871(-)|eukprot:CAMPEP_0185028526 /NCGR_PEP_ID=MMETSP1103-20130426/14285_1 /TAXON_ID=36769 /ORGANISM="Paraphysomonas bandaiensis, Strain Caron Lab Isolate" /LENGTH=231 /DNA_ID=CAMNT_0027562963 /DNA_START=66 /DNA_END=761 /DNA_ORIENTATION=+
MENGGNSNVFLDINALKSVENIKRVISQYREEQEELFMKICPEPSKSLTSNRDHSVERIFEHYCLISVGSDRSHVLGAWPSAIVGSFSNKTISLGNYESHGSLWRFLKMDSSNGPATVVIQCSEIGEKPMFLTSDLELSENNSYAAEWTVSLAPSANKHSSEATRICIRSADDSRLLCCHEHAGIALLSDEEVRHADDNPSQSSWISEWEAIAEDSAIQRIDELKFLEEDF